MMAIADLINYLNSIPAGYKSAEDICFAAANQSYIPEYKKLGVITISYELPDGAAASNSTKFYCNVPVCQHVFEDAATYQTHFNNVHRYLCSVCRRSLPTAHLLDLHVSERHDSYFATRVARGEAMYACLLEECKQKLFTQDERKDHCISLHKFPVNFRFQQFCGNASKGKQNKKEANNLVPDSTDVSEVSSAMCEIKAISFGQPKERTFQFKGTSKSKDTLRDLSTLRDALDEI